MTMSKYTKWTAIWGNAMSIADSRPEGYGRDITLRYPVFSPFEGDKIRLTFDNICGTEDIEITKVTIAEEDSQKPSGINAFGGRIKGETLKVLPGFVIPKGQKHVTSPIEFDVKADSKIVISFYLGNFTQMRSAVLVTGGLSEAYFAMGDATEREVLDPETTKMTRWFYFLSDVDVYTEEQNRAVICYGDSITAQDWPDDLTSILRENNIKNTSVIRKAASGTRILREYSNITYNSYGLKGENRVPREFDVAGADAVIIQQGINDIIHPVGVEKNQFRPMSDLPTSDELIDGIRRYIKFATEKNLKVYLGTLLPIYGWRTYEDFREDLKNEFNSKLKSIENTTLIDFHKAVEDKEDSRKFAPGFDSGDSLHPSKKAYRRMAEEAFKVLFEK